MVPKLLRDGVELAGALRLPLSLSLSRWPCTCLHLHLDLGVRQYARYINVIAASAYALGYASGMNRVCIGHTYMMWHDYGMTLHDVTYMCVCVCLCVCMCGHGHANMAAHLHTDMHRRMRIHRYPRTRVRACVHRAQFYLAAWQGDACMDGS